MKKFNTLNESQLSNIQGGWAKWGFWRCAGLAFQIHNETYVSKADKKAWSRHCG